MSTLACATWTGPVAVGLGSIILALAIVAVIARRCR